MPAAPTARTLPLGEHGICQCPRCGPDWAMRPVGGTPAAHLQAQAGDGPGHRVRSGKQCSSCGFGYACDKTLALRRRPTGVAVVASAASGRARTTISSAPGGTVIASALRALGRQVAEDHLRHVAAPVSPIVKTITWPTSLASSSAALGEERSLDMRHRKSVAGGASRAIRLRHPLARFAALRAAGGTRGAHSARCTGTRPPAPPVSHSVWSGCRQRLSAKQRGRERRDQRLRAPPFGCLASGGPSAQARFSSLRSIGSFLIRLPVAAKIALVTAGATVGTPGSPRPPGASPESRMCTSTTGISLILSIW